MEIKVTQFQTYAPFNMYKKVKKKTVLKAPNFHCGNKSAMSRKRQKNTAAR